MLKIELSVHYVPANWLKLRIKHNRKNWSFFSSSISESWSPMVVLFADSPLCNHMLELLLLPFLPEKRRVKTQSSLMTEIQICKGPWGHPVGYLQLVHISHVNMGDIYFPWTLHRWKFPRHRQYLRLEQNHFTLDIILLSLLQRKGWNSIPALCCPSELMWSATTMTTEIQLGRKWAKHVWGGGIKELRRK